MMENRKQRFYTVVKTDNQDILEADVDNLLQSDWNLHGGLVINNGVFYQVLTSHNEDEEYEDYGK